MEPNIVISNLSFRSQVKEKSLKNNFSQNSFVQTKDGSTNINSFSRINRPFSNMRIMSKCELNLDNIQLS